MKGRAGSRDLSMLQIKADLRLAKAAMDDARTEKPSKYVKYLKGQAGYHLQQAAEKLIKIQIYHSNVMINNSKIFKHSIGDLITYARSLGIPFYVPGYIDTHAGTITSWEAEGRYDIHVIVRIDTLEKAYSEIECWFASLQKNGYVS